MEKESLIKQVFLKWEKKRLVYNLILIVALLIRRPPTWAWFDTLFYGNILYFLGPAIEGYIEWLGYQYKWFMPVALGTGTLISIYTVFFFYKG
jgi:hypothetical protein